MSNERKPQAKSSALGSLHSAIRDAFDAGIVDRQTMRDFDVDCLTAIDHLEPSQIRQIREDARMSQALFAKVLNVTVSVVSKWERGEKRPSGPSLKLLTLVDKKGVDAIL